MLSYGGKDYALCFSWGVWETLLSEWGDDWQARLSTLMGGNPRDLRYVASLLSKGELGDAVQPPVTPTINAIYRAYELAWSGVDIGEAVLEAKADGKKPRSSLLSLLTRGRFGLDSGAHGRTSTV